MCRLAANSKSTRALQHMKQTFGAAWTMWIASAGIVLVLAGTVVFLLNKAPTADCAAEASTDHKMHEVRAAKVVVQPWLGEHHVYGIFVVPSRYRHNKKYRVTATVRGFDHSWASGERLDKQDVDGPVAEPGHFLLRSYVPTRVALWFLINGLFGDLRRPCNWTLVFGERSS